jgi:predicted phage baseplate assembly protein
MALPAPNLDNRRYADIVAEAKALIPRYTTEWTDLNESDPGITLVELFAWMSEMVLFRLNQVPDLNYIKFLELLGVQLRPAEPAKSEVTFTLSQPPSAATLIVPMGTRVAATPPDGGPSVVFETDIALNLLGPKLASILSFDGFAYSDVTAASAGQQVFYPLGPDPRQGSAIYLGFDFAGPFPDGTEVNLLALVASTAPQVTTVSCGLEPSEIVPPANLTWEGWDGNSWVKLAMNQDKTRAFLLTGHISIQVPSGLQLAKLKLPLAKAPYYWIRGRALKAAYDIAPALIGLLTNSVPVAQAQTVQGEVLGGSDGTPGQEFQLFFRPVVAGSLVLQIDEGSGPITWTEVEDFFSSDRDALVYTLDRDQGLIQVGDGEHGHAPVANPLNPTASVVAVQYRYGGGKDGNLPVGAINQLQGSIPGVASVTNLTPAVGGSDQESLEDAKLRAAAELKSRDRAVTAEDFSYLAKATPGARIRRAEAIPLAHPSFPGVPVPGAVSVMVIPDTSDPNPMPSEATMRTVCNQLNHHRLVTTELYIVAPTYHLVQVQAQVRVKITADLGTVRQAVDQALTGYFHPLTGGDDGQGWPLGGAIFYSLVVQKAMASKQGVSRIDTLTIRLDGAEQPFCEDVPIPQGSLLYSQGHDISVLYAS